MSIKNTLLRTTAFALALISGLAGPAIAGTWVTYRDETDWEGDRKQRSYQIDVASIVKHKGWIYANHRICLENMTDCRTVRSISAHCTEGKYTFYSTLVYTRRNGNEWWTDREIEAGTRQLKYANKEHQAFEKKLVKASILFMPKASTSSATELITVTLL